MPMGMNGLQFLYNQLFLLMFLYFCAFLSCSEISRFFIFLLFESIFTSDSSLLHLYFHQSPYFTLPLYFEVGFSRKILHATHISNACKLYYVGCLSNIAFVLVFSSLDFYFLMHHPTL